jgi:hypothetical protein
MHPRDPSPKSPTRRLQTPWTIRDTAVVVLLVVVATLSWLPRTRGPIDFRWDSAVYYTLGTSIYQHHSYRLLNEPGEIRATVYPPLLPMLVAGHQVVLGTTDPVVVGRWLRATFWVVLIGYFALAYALLRSGLATGWATLGVVLCALQWYPYWLSDRCYSDLPFAIVASLFFVLIRFQSGRGVGSGLSVVAAYLLRSAGIALLTAWVLERVLVGDWRSAIARAAVAAVPVLAWQGYVVAVEHSAEYRNPAYPYQRAVYNVYNVTYSDQATLRNHRHPDAGFATPRERVSRFFTNAALLPVALGGAVSAREEQWDELMDRIKGAPRIGRVIPWRTIPVVLGTLGVLIVVGLLVQVAAGARAIFLALVVNAAVVCLMPASFMYELPRYLAVFTPALTLALMNGIRFVRSMWPSRVVHIGVGSLLGIVVAVQIVVLAELFVHDNREITYTDWRGHRLDYRLFTYDEIALGQDRAIAWLNEHAQPRDIVVSSSPHWIYLRTGLRAVMPPMDADAADVQRLLDAVPAAYVLVEGPKSLGGEYVAPVVRQQSDQWELVVSDPEHDFEMYARRAR